MSTIPISQSDPVPVSQSFRNALLQMLSHLERRALQRAVKKEEKKQRKRNGTTPKTQLVYAENRAKRRLLAREEKGTAKLLKQASKNITSSNELRTPAFMVLATEYLKKIDFVTTINRNVQWDSKQWSVSPGHLALSIILSTFTQERFPLYSIKNNFDNMDLAYLFGNGVTQSMLNDDALGRALDRIYAAGCDVLADKILLFARAAFSLTFKAAHSDTTSVSLYGRYIMCESPDYDGLDITLGHSKAHRPDLKQFMLGNVVDENSIPLYYRIIDGNTADTEWNKETFPKLELMYGDQLANKIYIADSKAITLPNLWIYTKEGTKMFFLSRCPDNFYKKLTEKVKQQAYAAGNWVDIGQVKEDAYHTSYEGQEFCEIIRGFDAEKRYREVKVRLFVIRATDGKTRIAKRLAKEAEKLEEEITAIEKKIFNCCEDAQKVAVDFTKDQRHSLIDIETAIIKEEHASQGRGRQGKTPRPLKITTSWHIKVSIIGSNIERVQKAQQDKESIVLISNAPQSLLENTRSALLEYKAQYNVETGFRIIKSPALASEVFLKKPERIVVLAMLLEISLLIRRLMQYKAREREKLLSEKPRIDYENRELKNPTIEHLAKLLQYVELITCNGEYHFWVRNETDRKRLEYSLWLLELSE